MTAPVWPLLLTLLPVPAAAPTAPAAPLDVARDIQPLLQRACLDCHGARRQRGGLRLDQPPGAAARREIVRRLALPHGSRGAMPPRGEPLDAAQIALLRAWIDRGAPWTDPPARSPHWAYVAPRRSVPPTVRQADWPRQPIDAFVLARLEGAGLSPSPPADRLTLLRRLSLDLTGLPPVPGEIDAFLADARPDAYERLVERLLASPAFGERWARHWLDLARYADSHGYQRDDLRPAWPFRDRVIRAFNADLPFDAFTIEQLAGDLLPGATVEQKLATGFHRCAPTNVEAGADPEDTRVTQVFDRVNTTAAVWLGTTLECAQCHDHKSDPFTQQDYYGLYAFFNSTALEADRANPRVPGSIRFLGPYLTIAGVPPVSALVMQELPRPRPTRLLRRGDWRSPGETVRAATPAVLPPLPAGPANRLTLARWLVRPDQPLTARVTVNRLWAELFGRGIVSTLDDFGVKGEPPSHPELLDWLAVEFVERGWSLKQVLRRLVSSATYRQASRQTPLLRDRDPDNRLFARLSRQRLEAEAVRDNALAIAGLLNRTMYGAPVRPYQPPGLWLKVGGERVEYVVSPGEDRYRRGVYVVWKRSAPYPGFVAFDATARLTCTVRRPRTSTPLQALALLNDPVHVEAALAFAGRLIRERPGEDAPERLRHAFQLALARLPRPAEAGVLLRLHDEARRAAEADPTAAAQLAASFPLAKGVESVELAAWYAVTTALLNLDEAITRE